MRPVIAFIFITFSVLFALPVLAENPARPNPMQYTRVRETPQDNQGQQIKLKTIRHGEEEKKEEEEPSARIWNKYRALASGQPELTGEEKAAREAEEKQLAEEAAAEKEKKDAEAEKTEKEPARPTGIAAIIDEYKKNKAQRSQMRSITITKPSEAIPPEAEKAREKPGT